MPAGFRRQRRRNWRIVCTHSLLARLKGWELPRWCRQIELSSGLSFVFILDLRMHMLDVYKSFLFVDEAGAGGARMKEIPPPPIFCEAVS